MRSPGQKMLKILLFLIIAILISIQITSLLNTQIPDNTIAKHVHIKQLTLPKEENITIQPYFEPDNWLLTSADKASIPKNEPTETMENDSNTTLQIITQKGSRQLCKGKKCITIIGIVSDTLVLEIDKNATAIKPGAYLFDCIIFKGLHGTTLNFENNNTKERYNLKFFSYVQHTETNTTKIKKEK